MASNIVTNITEQDEVQLPLPETPSYTSKWVARLKDPNHKPRSKQKRKEESSVKVDESAAKTTKGVRESQESIHQKDEL